MQYLIYEIIIVKWYKMNERDLRIIQESLLSEVPFKEFKTNPSGEVIYGYNPGAKKPSKIFQKFCVPPELTSEQRSRLERFRDLVHLFYLCSLSRGFVSLPPEMYDKTKEIANRLRKNGVDEGTIMAASEGITVPPDFLIPIKQS